MGKYKTSIVATRSWDVFDRTTKERLKRVNNKS